jgi:hypothetical protein
MSNKGRTMADSDELLNTLVEVAHGFEVDINTVVVVNHQITIDGIANLEQREVERVREEFAAEDPDVLDSLVRTEEWFYSDLRKAAHNLALVGLVTRLQHWIEKFARELDIKPTRGDDSVLIRYLQSLNGELGDGPVPIKFFQELVMARDSVIHADSRAQWSHKKMRREVAPRYRSGFDLEISEEQLKEAVAKAIEQVKWYEEKRPTRRARPSPLAARPGA